MGKTFDKVGVSLIAAMLFFLLFMRVTHSIAMGVICALLSVIVLASFFALLRPRAPKHLLSKKNFVRYILLKGTGELKSLVEKSFEEKYPVKDADGHTLLCGKSPALLYYAYKFGSLSEEDVAKSYRLAEKHGCPAIYALTNHLDRKAIAVTEYIPQKFTVISATTLYKYLLKKSLIPPKEALEKKSGKVSKFLKTALNAGNTKYYIWAGLSTALLALFTPITTYYILFAFVNLALAVACLLFSEKSEGNDELFKG